MSILLTKESKIMVQGITGREGRYHAQRMQEYGHNVVAGTSPGHGGEWVLDGKVPVFDTVEEAKRLPELIPAWFLCQLTMHLMRF